MLGDKADRGGGITKRQAEPFQDNWYIYYLDRMIFSWVYTSANFIEFYSLHISSLLCQLYLNKIVFKGVKGK